MSEEKYVEVLALVARVIAYEELVIDCGEELKTDVVLGRGESLYVIAEELCMTGTSSHA